MMPEIEENRTETSKSEVALCTFNVICTLQATASPLPYSHREEGLIAEKHQHLHHNSIEGRFIAESIDVEIAKDAVGCISWINGDANIIQA